MSVNLPNKHLNKFNFWVQRVLPQVYDDSLSHYELLNKVVHHLNEVIESQNKTNDNFEALNTIFNVLKQFVDTYFDVLNVQDEIDTKLNGLVKDGTMDEVLNQRLLNSKATWSEVRLRSEKIKLEDLTEQTLGAITGQTPFSLLSVPQDGSVTPKKTNFIEPDKVLNHFDGVYARGIIEGAEPFRYQTSDNGRTAVVPIKPNTTYSFIRQTPSRLNWGTATKLLAHQEGLDGSIKQNNSGSGTTDQPKNITFTSGANDRYLYVNVSNQGTEPFLQIVEGVQTMFTVDFYPIRIKNGNYYSRKEIDDMVVTPEKTSFIKYDGKNLFDGSFVKGKYLSGAEPLILGNNADYQLVAIPVKANTTYTVLVKDIPLEDGFYWFKIATSKKTVTELLSMSSNFTMDGAVTWSRTSNPTERYTFKTGATDKALLFNVAKYAKPYTEVLEGDYSSFQYTDYNQGDYVPNGVSIYSKKEVDEMIRGGTTDPGKLHVKKLDQNNFQILYPSRNGNFVAYTYGRHVNNNIALDVWRLKDIQIFNSNLTPIHTITEGDNEGVLRINGEVDYIGGVHGDELQTNLFIYLDGIEINPTTDNVDGFYQSIEFLVFSDIYRAETTTKAFEKVKHVTFNSKGVNIKNKWKSLGNFSLLHVRGCLLSIHKKSNGVDLIKTFRDTNVVLLPRSVATGTMPNDSSIEDMTLHGGLVTAKIWSIKRGGNGNRGTIADFGHRLKVYIDSYTGEQVTTGQLVHGEHQFLITTK